ncbi:hypothetical protein T492DRAFT_862603 [Pavlovales sp. CCMP2436]|nr:hypothetical protein T492DRAFT_862603 [Pavlovales sp. CCMP2436]
MADRGLAGCHALVFAGALVCLALSSRRMSEEHLVVLGAAGVLPTRQAAHQPPAPKAASQGGEFAAQRADNRTASPHAQARARSAA